MGKIKTIHDIKRNLVTQKCVGAIDIGEVKIKIEEHFKVSPTKNILWDLTEADLTGLASEQIRKLALQIAAVKPESKSALLVNSALSLGLANMFATYMDLEFPNVLLRVFVNQEEALSFVSDG